MTPDRLARAKKPATIEGAMGATMKSGKLNVFVSYSHEDEAWLERVQVHLKPLAREGRLDLWADTRIKTGERWHEEIKAALARADVAVLLISADFFASEFIANKELPPLLEAARNDRGLVIAGLHINYSRFDRNEILSEYQTVNKPDHPVEGLSKAEQEKVFDDLARRIEELLATKLVDEEQALARRAPPPGGYDPWTSIGGNAPTAPRPASPRYQDQSFGRPPAGPGDTKTLTIERSGASQALKPAGMVQVKWDKLKALRVCQTDLVTNVSAYIFLEGLDEQLIRLRQQLQRGLKNPRRFRDSDFWDGLEVNLRDLNQTVNDKPRFFPAAFANEINSIESELTSMRGKIREVSGRKGRDADGDIHKIFEEANAVMEGARQQLGDRLSKLRSEARKNLEDVRDLTSEIFAGVEAAEERRGGAAEERVSRGVLGTGDRQHF